MDAAHHETKFLQDISWGEVNGKRVQRLKNTFRGCAVGVIVLALISEPIRFLTEQFLRSASEVRNRQSPATFEYINPLRSPIVAALQYLTSLLSGDSPRLVLLYARHGLGSFAEWMESCPDEALCLKHGAITVIAWISERHHRLFSEPPLLDLSLGDTRLSKAAKEDHIARICTRASCCTPWGYARDMTRKHPSFLRSPQHAAIIYRTAQMMVNVIADIECRHARCRRNLEPGTTWPTFCADYCNQEAQAVSTVASLRHHNTSADEAGAGQTHLPRNPRRRS